jgi:hypothetical protein
MSCRTGLRACHRGVSRQADLTTPPHYMWGSAFRLPTRYLLPQKAFPLASQSHRGKLPVCHLAFGRLHPAGPAAPGATGANLSAASSSWTVKWTKLLSGRFGCRMLSGGREPDFEGTFAGEFAAVGRQGGPGWRKLASILGRKALAASGAPRQTRCYPGLVSQPVAAKCDGSKHRRSPGRPRVRAFIGQSFFGHLLYHRTI